MELCCQGLNSSCKRPAAPCHAPLVPRWLRDVPAALRRSAHEKSVMEWLSETPGSIPRHTTVTLLLLQPPGRTPKSEEGRLCSLVCQLTDGRQRRWWCPQCRPACSRAWGGGGLLEREHMPAWPGMPLLSLRRSSQWPSADDQQESGKLDSAQRWRGEMLFFTHTIGFDKWVVSAPCQPNRECAG